MYLFISIGKYFYHVVMYIISARISKIDPEMTCIGQQYIYVITNSEPFMVNNLLIINHVDPNISLTSTHIYNNIALLCLFVKMNWLFEDVEF